MKSRSQEDTDVNYKLNTNISSLWFVVHGREVLKIKSPKKSTFTKDF